MSAVVAIAVIIFSAAAVAVAFDGAYVYTLCAVRIPPARPPSLIGDSITIRPERAMY